MRYRPRREVFAVAPGLNRSGIRGAVATAVAMITGAGCRQLRGCQAGLVGSTSPSVAPERSRRDARAHVRFTCARGTQTNWLTLGKYCSRQAGGSDASVRYPDGS
jgi:hypothetical protein